jgi:hypothetical protein
MVERGVIEENTNEPDTTEIQYRVSGKNASSWSKYVLIALILSIGYLFILIDSFDELFIPADRAFSFRLDEQVLGLIVPNIIMILIAPVVWQKVADSIIHNQVVRSFERAENRSITAQPLSLLGKVFGMRTYSGKQNYYIEKNVEATKLDDFRKTLGERILSAISSNIGFTFYIAFIINFFLPSDLSGKDALFLSIMVMQLVPLFISWIVPVNWVLKDVLIRHIGTNRIIHDMGEAMSNGILDRFIGIGGFIVGLSVAYDLAYSATGAEITNIVVAGIYFLFYFLLLSSGSIVMISILYLSNHHEDIVTSPRKQLSESVPIAELRINELDPSTVQLPVLPERSRARGILKALGILVLLAVIVFCEYYVLFVIGPFGF